MDHYLERNRNPVFLGALLLAQLFLLGYQVRRPNAGGVRLVRLWSLEAILPAERLSSGIWGDSRSFLHGYVGLREVNQQNQSLQAQLTALRLENERLREGVRELPALESLLGFQRAYGLKTVAAPIISSGLTADAQTVYLDGGASAGFTRDMAVISPQGLVGKLTLVLGASSQVLLLTDPTSGVGVLIGPTGVHGIARGLGAGRIEVRNVLKDEPVVAGASIITSGEDQVYPKGIPVGTVTGVHASTDGVFQTLDVQLAADLGRLEQVLVITAALPPPPQASDAGQTAAQIRQAQLPSLPDFSAPPNSPPGTWPLPKPAASAAAPAPAPISQPPAKPAPAKIPGTIVHPQ